MGEIARSLGLGGSLKYQGKDYRLAACTFEMQGLFELWLEGRAWEAAKRSQKQLAPGEYQEGLAQVGRDIAAGQYSFGSEVSLKALTSAPGQIYMLFLMLNANHREVDLAMAREVYESDMVGIMERMNEANSDPKAPAPETTPPE